MREVPFRRSTDIGREYILGLREVHRVRAKNLTPDQPLVL